MELCVGTVNYNEITFNMTPEQTTLNITPRFLIEHPNLKLFLIKEDNVDGTIIRSISSNASAVLNEGTTSSLSFLFHYWEDGGPAPSGFLFIASDPDEFFAIDD